MTTDLAQFRPLLAEALQAFRSDSSYAEDIARQGAILIARQQARKLKEQLDAPVLVG